MLGLTRTSKLREAERERANAEERLEIVEDERSTLGEGLDTLVSELPRLPEANEPHGEVRVLTQPRVAFKGTCEAVVVGIVPEGATVVVPDDIAQSNEGFDYDKLRVNRFLTIAVREGGFGSFVESDENLHPAYNMEYEVGEEQSALLDDDRLTVCTRGIHVFREFDHAYSWYMAHRPR